MARKVELTESERRAVKSTLAAVQKLALTKSQLAQRLNVNRQTLWNIEQGKSCSYDTAHKIVRFAQEQNIPCAAAAIRLLANASSGTELTAAAAAETVSYLVSRGEAFEVDARLVVLHMLLQPGGGSPHPLGTADRARELLASGELARQLRSSVEHALVDRGYRPKAVARAVKNASHDCKTPLELVVRACEQLSLRDMVQQSATQERVPQTLLQARKNRRPA